VTKIIDTI